MTDEELNIGKCLYWIKLKTCTHPIREELNLKQKISRALAPWSCINCKFFESNQQEEKQNE